jgi:diaminobutyrate-2-oxoglutarate transaminase
MHERSSIELQNGLNDQEAFTRTFEDHESNVREYSRRFPAVLHRAKGAELWDYQGRRFLDFFAGAGALNYGHNQELIKQALIEYLKSDGIVHALDFYTTAKKRFLDHFANLILKPRNLDYHVQFCGPTGTNAVEASLKLARKVTGRQSILSFSGSYHGGTLASLAVTGNKASRSSARVPLYGTYFVPFPESPAGPFDSLGYIERMLEDSASGVELPAAVILETVQMDGGVYIASEEWLRALRRTCDRYGMLLICDDVQVGCGRTGAFFSFERAGIVPDIVLLAKSISAYGLPMALVLIRAEVDQWSPGEHCGTFRGNQLAFVAAAAALEQFWTNGTLQADVARKGEFLRGFLHEQIASKFDGLDIRGVGMAWGIDGTRVSPTWARRVQDSCFERGLLIECSGRDDTVLKILPPLTIEREALMEGCHLLASATESAWRAATGR